jgi:hypothetical protein
VSIASEGGHYECVKYLVENGANIHVPDEVGGLIIIPFVVYKFVIGWSNMLVSSLLVRSY